MIPILGVPILNRGDLLLRLFNSIDYPIEILHIIANSTADVPEESVRTAISTIERQVNQGHLVHKCVVEYGAIYNETNQLITRNLGVAGSWNKVLKTYPHAKYIMFVGNDIQLKNGSLKNMDTVMCTIENRLSVGTVSATGSYNCFALFPEIVNTVGYFDENIYPAYLEDCDYAYRIKLVGLISHTVAGVDYIHGEAPTWGSSTIYSNKEYKDINDRTHERNFEYYKRKWGGINEQEIFTHPFNSIKHTVQYWLTPKQVLLW